MRVPNAGRVLAASLVLAAGCSSSSNDGGGPAFSQADLAGTWDRIGFSSNDVAGWFVHGLTVDAAGQVTFDSCLTQVGPCTVTATVTYHVDSTGTVYATGNGANPTIHGTMTKSKDLIFATASLPGTGTPNTGYNVQVFRKRVPGVTFSSADVASLPFAYQQLHAGLGTDWERGAGSSDASGSLTLDWSETSSGPRSVPAPGFDALQVDANGLVTLVNTPSFHGVMTADKKAIFAVMTTVPPPSTPEYAFTAILATGQSFAQGDIVGTWNFHALTSGPTVASSSWVHGTFDVDAAGTVAFTSATNQNGPVSIAGFTLLAGPSGTMTRPDLASYLGQISFHKDFWVRTQTSNGANSLGISAR